MNCLTNDVGALLSPLYTNAVRDCMLFSRNAVENYLVVAEMLLKVDKTNIG